MSDPAPASTPQSSDSDAASPSPSASASPSASSASRGTEHVQYDLHVTHPPITEEVQKEIDTLRKSVESDETATARGLLTDPDIRRFLTDQNLHRFLRARNFDHSKSLKLLVDCLEWRRSFKPSSIRAAEVESECVTGKIIVRPELDRHNRPIIVMDSSRENSKGHENQLRHLVFQLERAKRKMNVEVPVSQSGVHVEKYCLFVNMTRHSMRNAPPLKTSLETLKTLTARYVEHLGHAIVYQPGFLFAGLWAACKPFLDARTVSKVIFIRGDTSDGSANDLLLKEIIGDDWRKLCDVAKDDYDHATFWPQVLKDEAEALEREKLEAENDDKLNNKAAEQHNGVAPESSPNSS